MAHKLSAYTWNLVENYPADFHVVVTEVGERDLETTRFRTRAAFRREETKRVPYSEGLLLDEPGFRVRSVCLAREAGVKEVVPFHFSAKYNGAGERLFQEVQAAFAGRSTNGAVEKGDLSK